MAGGDTELLLRLQTEVLEAVARGDALADVGDILCRRAEKNAPGTICSILLVDEEARLRPLAAPSLPSAFHEAIDGVAIGPCVGSCGTAAWRKTPVVVTDIASDPLWDGHREYPLALGLRACWSSPICDNAGNVVATFAFYFDTPRGPTAFERQAVATCVHLCALAIEHDCVRTRNHRLAYFDSLTALPNRRHFADVLAARVRGAEPFGLVLLDIDHLKRVNDSIGHAAGDALIRTVAARLSAGGPDILPFRLGGDEFAVLVAGCADHAALEAAAMRILAATGGMATAGGQSIDPHVTMGGAVFGLDGGDADTLCQNADFALYQAKQSHRGGYIGFQPDLRTAMVQRIASVRELDRAMVEGRLVPHYQPVVRLDTGEIAGLEALARVVSLDGRVMAAGEFQAAFEDPRVAYDITGHMLDRIARDIRGWLDADIPFGHVAVNVTTGDFRRGNLAARIGQIFAARRVPLSHVVLEVNESVFMGDADRTVPVAVEALREQGILVALDDFGTGFASLTHLLSFPVDIIKVDRSFVHRLGSDTPGEVVVHAILDIARQLGMDVVAEGIETAEQAQMLRAFGCALGQGYFFSRPVSAADATDLMRACARSRPAARFSLAG